MNLDETDRTLCAMNGNQCKICSGSNCNSATSFTQCIHCVSKKSDSKCIESLDPNQSNICKRYNDECFTFIDQFKISRGCLSDQSDQFEDLCRKREEKCSICSANNGTVCNDKAIVLETCIECDSSKDDECQHQSNHYEGRICSTIDSTNGEGCFLNTVKDFNF